ncbi:MAG: trigger factor [Firmicutes bacterium]|nr:trigger factor [Bacillota bacterium]MCL5040807.1 trigger factor [Bacillota bacterium]
MKINLETMEKDKATFEITLPPEDVARGLEGAYRKLVKRVNVPGFRKGKAPRHILERFVGREALQQEALETLVPEAYESAIKELKIEPIDQPTIDDIEIAAGQPLVFKVSVAVSPEVQLGDYQSLHIKEDPVVVIPERVDQELEHLREQHSHLVVEGPESEVKEGHFAVIDYKGYIDGQEFAGGAGEGQLLEVGSHTFIPGFEEQLMGARAGEEREIKVTFPEDYRAQDLAGKEALFKVKIQEIKRRVLPDLDDDLARMVGQFQTLQELREETANRVSKTEKAQARQELEKKVVDAIADMSVVKPPDILIDRRIDRLMAELEDHLKQQGLTLDDYLTISGKDLNTFRQEFREPAEKGVKRDLVIKAVARKEGLTVSEEDIDRYLAGLAGLYRQPIESIMKSLGQGAARERLRESMLMDKTIDHLVEKVTASPENQSARPDQEL